MSTSSVLRARTWCVALVLVAAGCESGPDAAGDGAAFVDLAGIVDLRAAADLSVARDLEIDASESSIDLARPADMVTGTCSGACAAGEYLASPCTSTADRVCSPCTAVASCGAVTCTTATDQTCAACDSHYYASGGACVACSATCAPGTYETAPCTTTADHVCSDCTAVAHCAKETCTSAVDQSCASCDAGYYASSGTCQACSAFCPIGTYQTTACSESADIACAMCTPIADCAMESCTSAGDAACAACSAGFYLSGGTCHACSGSCGAGSYQSAACNATMDRTCATCTAIPSCTTETCTTASDQACTACAGGNWLGGGTCHGCTAILGCSSAVSCTSATTSQCISCAPAHYLVDGPADTCPPCTACAGGSYVKTACSGAADTQCETCPSHCTACTSSVACTACVTGYTGSRCDIHPAGTYPFEEASGTDLLDASGAGIDGQVASATRTSGVGCHSGRCLSFDGSSDALLPSVAANRFGTDDFTIAAFINTTHTGTEDVVFGNNVCGIPSGYLVAVANGKAGFAAFGAGAPNTYILSSADVSDGLDHFVVAQRAGTALSLFVDGALVGSATVDAAWSSDTASAVLPIGNISGCGGHGFVGTIDELLVSRGALDATTLDTYRNRPVTFLETFSAFAPAGSAIQCDTGNVVYFGGDLFGWSKSGLNAVHAVEPVSGNVAVSFYDGNAIELVRGLALNQLGTTYRVEFSGGPSVWAGCGQCTSSGDDVLFEIVRADDSVLASYHYIPGAWAGTQALSAAAFTYVGDGTGAVRLRISSDDPGSDRFSGAVDDVYVHAE